MARWRLNTPHYLNVPGTEWEQKEVSTQTGKQIRKVYQVPLLLNPDLGTDQTPPASGETIVCWEGKGQPTDYVFVGDPTADMTPIDAEAEKVTEEMRPLWKHPVDSLNPTGPAALAPETLVMMEQFAKQIGAAVQAPNSGVSRSEFDELKSMLASMQKQNAELKAALAVKRP